MEYAATFLEALSKHLTCLLAASHEQTDRVPCKDFFKDGGPAKSGNNFLKTFS